MAPLQDWRSSGYHRRSETVSGLSGFVLPPGVVWACPVARPARRSRFPASSVVAGMRMTLSRSLAACLAFLVLFVLSSSQVWAEGCNAATDAAFLQSIRLCEDHEATRLYLEQCPGGRRAGEAAECLAWVAVRDCTDRASVEQFVEEHPKGPYSEEARDCLVELQDAAWNDIKDCEEKDRVEQFLKDFPQSPHTGQALVCLARLEVEKELLFWESVKDSADPRELEAYLLAWPYGTYAVLAHNRLDKLLATGADDMAMAAASEMPEEPEGEKEAQVVSFSAEIAETSLGLVRGERRAIQRGLASLGFDPGPVDGLFGHGTRRAIERWQASLGADATGYLAAEEAKALLAADKKAEAEARIAPGTVFRSCDDCPEMVVVPAGSFMMGSPAYEDGRQDDEGPQQHRVTITEPFAIGRFEVTRGEFRRFVDATGHSMGGSCWTWEYDEWVNRAGRGWHGPSFYQSERDPGVCVDWDDAKAYVAWLSRKTGERYRLLSEAEWEYAARAGTTGPFHTGTTISTDQANYDGNHTYGAGSEGVYREKTVPVGSFAPNAFGLYDMHGNVWEWVEDCWHDSYSGAPMDGRARTLGGSCDRRVLRGGSWYSNPEDLRAANRYVYTIGVRSNNLGFRLARTLTP